MEIDFLKDSKPTLHKKLLQNGFIDFQSILTIDDLELQELLNLSEAELQELKYSISLKVPASKLGTTPDTRLSTGCKQIDAILNGGLPTQRVLELFGSSGSGKTQFCLQLLQTVQLPINKGGLAKRAVYVCTEPPFPSRRFHALCETASERFHMDNVDFENNVYINTCYDTELLLECLKEKLPKLVRCINVGLIVIDTIAAVFRGNDDLAVDYIDRSEKFQEIVKCIRLLARSANAVILCVNQVTDNPETNETDAAMGSTWAGLVAQRYEISRAECFSSTRLFSVNYSYESQLKSVEFNITNDGIV